MVLINGVKVGGINYKVEEKPTLGTIDGEECVGLCEYHDATISVLDRLSDDRKDQTFVHELTHAIFLEAGYDLGEQDEDMINRIGIVLHQVLKDNYVPKNHQVVDYSEIADGVAKVFLECMDNDMKDAIPIKTNAREVFWINTKQAKLENLEVNRDLKGRDEIVANMYITIRVPQGDYGFNNNFADVAKERKLWIKAGVEK